jgi:hypothetical protein
MSGLVISALTCTSIWAQATAQISGTVKDQSGAVLPGVEITATQTGTGATRTAVTNETGSFVLPSLPLGPYRVEAGLPGFRTFVQTGIVLQVDSSATINAVLEVGQVTETVEVEANATQVETRSVGISNVIETQRILELPLDGRQVENLITLSGAAVSSGATNSGGARAVGGQFISVAGGIASGVEYQLDGANHMNYAAGSGNALPFPDALQEFNVRTSGLTADAGRGAGVGAVTKSGTNEFHGDLFEFVRNDLFNAHEYFAVGKSSLKRNQFGGVIGGPVLKDRLFFFAGYQHTTLRSDPRNVQAWIPTPQMLAGDWTTFASPACNGNRAVNLRAPFVNGRIDPARFSRAAVRIVGLLPQSGDPCGLFTYGQRNISNGPQLVVRMDHKLSNSHTLFGRFFAYSELNPTPYSFDEKNILLAPTITDNRQAKTTTLGSTYVIGPRIINSFRASYNREMIHRAGNKWLTNGICEFGVNVYCGYTPTHMNLNISGGNAFNLGQTSRPDDILFTEGYDVGNDVSLVMTSHQITIGGGFNRTRHQASTSSKSPPELTFNNQNTGSGLGDFMTGQLFTLQQNAPNAHNPYRWFTRAYVSDTWKVASRLTLSYGVRWEPFIPEQRPNLTAYNFDLERFEKGIRSKVYVNAPAGFTYYGDDGFPNGTAGVNKNWAQFSPRLGLAWDVTGDGKTSIRASYSYSYEVQPMQYTNNASSGSPNGGGRVTVTSPTGGFENPWRDVPGGNPFPLVVTKDFIFPAFAELQTQPVDMKMPRTATWNLSVQRELPHETVLSMSYLGSLVTQLPEQAPINPAIYIPGSCVLPDGRTYNPCSTIATTDLRRRFSLQRYSDGKFIGLFSDLRPGSTQNYNGLVTSIKTRPTKDMNVNVNYTWSHCIGDPVNGFTSSGGAKADQTFTKAFDRRYDHGDCVLDRRQIFNLTTVLATPEFANPTLRAIGTGWRWATIYKRSSGSPLNVTTGQDNALTGISSQRPNQVLGDVYTGKSDPLGFFLNRDAFAVPAAGTYGNLGNFSVVGPVSWDFDMALSRIFKLHESQSLEVRGEAFNVTNSFRPTNPNVNSTSSQFGQLRGARPPRIMQFALKYVF